MARKGRVGWLVGAGVLVAGAAAFAVFAYLSLSSARTDRDEMGTAVAEAEARAEVAISDRDDGVAARSAAAADLQAAGQELTAAEEAVADAEQQQSQLETAQRQAGVEEAGLRAAAALYHGTAEDVVAAIGDHLEIAGRLVGLREEQAGAVAAGHYRTFNSLQDGYNALVGDFNEQSETVAAALAALPAFGYRDLASSVTPTAPTAVTALDTPLDPPTGPARVVGSFPDSIPCTPRSEGCRWSWEITFTETNTLAVTIERLGIRYTDRRGSVWVSQSGEWRTVSIVVPPLGTRTWDSWVQSLDPDSEGNLQGATLQVRWEGTDAEGNSISGRARVTLEWRKDD